MTKALLLMVAWCIDNIIYTVQLLVHSIKNFSVIMAPLTNLLKKDQEYVWSRSCQEAFEKVKSVLLSIPVVMAPNFQKQLLLMVDASGVGAGAVLMQSDSKGIEHPVCYFSCKFNPSQRNYSTIEKEALVLVLALQNFDVRIFECYQVPYRSVY